MRIDRVQRNYARACRAVYLVVEVELIRVSELVAEVPATQPGYEVVSHKEMGDGA